MFKHFEQCRQVTKNKNMRSTLKIDGQNRHQGITPVIKIVQPIEIKERRVDPTEEVDPKDTLLVAFLQDPLNIYQHTLFGLSSHYAHPFENPTHFITNIEPISNENLFYRLRGIIKQNIEERGLKVDLKEVDELFDKIDLEHDGKLNYRPENIDYDKSAVLGKAE